MKLDTLAALYVLVGAGAVVVLAARRGLDGRLWLDGPLLLICWPLYGPFLAMGDGAREPALLGALRVAREGPLAALLPDGDALERLATRHARATARAAELDRLLGDADFDLARAEARADALAAQGRAGAAAAARRTAEHIARLHTLRDRARADLAEVEELTRQLRTQAELVRLAGPGEDAGVLIAALVDRVDALDAALADPVLNPPV